MKRNKFSFFIVFIIYFLDVIAFTFPSDINKRKINTLMSKAIFIALSKTKGQKK